MNLAFSLDSIFARFSWRIYLILSLPIVLGSCSNLKYLKNDQKLLTNNAVHVHGVENKRLSSELKYELDRRIYPNPNKKFLGLFRVGLSIHNWAKQRRTTKVNSWLMETIGDSAVLYNEAIVGDVERDMEKYLVSRGFFNAEVKMDSVVRGKKIKLIYNAYPRKRMLIDSIRLVSLDNNVQGILNREGYLLQLKAGDPVDYYAFEKERRDITVLMRDRGYAFFYPNYINFRVDTINTKGALVFPFISMVQDSFVHKPYKIRNIYVRPKFDGGLIDSAQLKTFKREGLSIISATEDFGIKERVLLNNITFRPNRLFTYRDFQLTSTRLADLGIYRAPDIRYYSVSEEKNLVDVVINLKEAKKMSVGADFEVSTIQESAIRSSIGLGLKLSYQNRNLFKGGEILRINTEGRIEVAIGNRSATRTINGQSLNLSAELTLPRILFPLPNKSSGKTVFSSNYRYLNNIDYYSYRSINASYGYVINLNKRSSLIYTPIGVNYLFPVTTALFDTILTVNPYLLNSFERQFILGSSYQYIYNGIENRDGFTWGVDALLDNAGLVMKGINELISPDEPLSIGNGATYSQYVKAQFSTRMHYRLSRSSLLAGRVVAGVGYAYGNSDVLPYVKQFYMGGPSSMRAWRIRELGPGSHVDTFQLNNNIQPYQTGDVRFELNAEYRFQLFGDRFKWALFTDIGNIWTLRNNLDNRTGVSFAANRFLSDLAVGAGYGLRLDFSIVLIRLDAGFKIKNPYKDELLGTYSHYNSNNRFSFRKFFTDPSYQLAIGYPF